MEILTLKLTSFNSQKRHYKHQHHKSIWNMYYSLPSTKNECVSPILNSSEKKKNNEIIIDFPYKHIQWNSHTRRVRDVNSPLCVAVAVAFAVDDDVVILFSLTLSIHFIWSSALCVFLRLGSRATMHFIPFISETPNAILLCKCKAIVSCVE